MDDSSWFDQNLSYRKYIGCIYCGREVDRGLFLVLSSRKYGECSKCHKIRDNLLFSSSCKGRRTSDGGNIFCVICFVVANSSNSSNRADFNLKCPCCQEIFCDYAQSIEEGILIGEGTYACYEAKYQEKQGYSDENIYHFRKKAIEKYEKALFMYEDYSLNVIDFLINAYYQCIQTCVKIEINPNSRD